MEDDGSFLVQDGVGTQADGFEAPWLFSDLRIHVNLLYLVFDDVISKDYLATVLRNYVRLPVVDNARFRANQLASFL